MSQKVLKSYFEYAQEAEAFDWNEQGILEREGQIITYGCYNNRMNQAVCSEARQKNCEKVAKSMVGKRLFER